MLKAEINSVTLYPRGPGKPGNEGNRILGEINFELEENKIYTIMGKNGSGKTTLLKALTGLLDKRFYSTDGKVFFHNQELLSADPESILQIRREKIKYIFQDAVNSFDHLKKFSYYFKHISRDEIEVAELLEYFILPPKEKLYNMYPYEVSGGMAQRISFILALSAKPDLLIMDEPTSGIDTAIANLFMMKLKELTGSTQKTSSILLVTQDIDFAEKSSDKISFINEKKLSIFMPPEEFLKSFNRKNAG